MEKALSPERNTLFNSVGSFFYLMCQWLITVLVVALGSFEDAGALSLSMSVTNVFFTLATFGLHEYQVSDFRNHFTPDQYFSTRLFTCLSSMALCAAVTILLSGYTSDQAGCIILYMLFRVAEAFADLFQAMEQKAERMDKVMFSFLLRGVLILCSFCLILHFSGSLLWAIFGMGVLSLSVVFLYDRRVCRLLTRSPLRYIPVPVWSLLRDCLPLMCTSFFLAALVAVPRSTLEAQWGGEMLGFYASVATPTVIVQSAAMWLYMPFLPALTRSYAARDRAAFDAHLRKIGLIAAGCCLLVFLGAKFLGAWGLKLIFGEEILPHVWLLLPVLLSTLLIALSCFLSALLTIARKLRIIAAATVAGSALSMLLSPLFVGRFGMNGINLVLYAAVGLTDLILLVSLLNDCRKHFI